MLVLGDLSPHRKSDGSQSPKGQLSPLNSPSLRHRLGLPISPKPVVAVSTQTSSTTQTLEQAKRTLELDIGRLSRTAQVAAFGSPTGALCVCVRV
jgi:hypothetical protein